VSSSPKKDIPEVQKQDVHTGEEDEEKIHSFNVKVFQLESGEESKVWKERGKGELRLNVRKDDAKKSRVIFRTDKIHKLVLNMPLYSNTSVDKASDTSIRLCGFNNIEKLQFESFLIRLRSKDETATLAKALEEYRSKSDPLPVSSENKPSEEESKPAADDKKEDDKKEDDKKEAEKTETTEKEPESKEEAKPADAETKSDETTTETKPSDE